MTEPSASTPLTAEQELALLLDVLEVGPDKEIARQLRPLFDAEKARAEALRQEKAVLESIERAQTTDIELLGARVDALTRAQSGLRAFMDTIEAVMVAGIRLPMGNDDAGKVYELYALNRHAVLTWGDLRRALLVETEADLPPDFLAGVAEAITDQEAGYEGKNVGRNQGEPGGQPTMSAYKGERADCTPKAIAKSFGVASDGELGGAAFYFLHGPGVDHPKRNSILRIIARAGKDVPHEPIA